MELKSCNLLRQIDLEDYIGLDRQNLKILWTGTNGTGKLCGFTQTELKSCINLNRKDAWSGTDRIGKHFWVRSDGHVLGCVERRGALLHHSL